MDGGEREGEFGEGGEAGGEGCCVGAEVVDWLLGWGRLGLGSDLGRSGGGGGGGGGWGLGEEDEEVGVDVRA